jgi:U3 small nucleolar RNA-associated protein 12
VWGLDVSSDGAFVLSVGQDRSLRVWERGDDLVFVEEERERAMEFEVDRAATGGNGTAASGSGGSAGVGGSGVAEGAVGSVEGDTSAGSSSSSSLASIDSVRGGEMLMDALDLVLTELALQAERTAAAR